MREVEVMWKLRLIFPLTILILASLGDFHGGSPRRFSFWPHLGFDITS